MGIYEQFGLQPIINASGAVTRLGGAPLDRAALAAFVAAADECIPLEQLQAAASREIAQCTGTESALVTSGAAAALTLGAAAILAGLDPARMERLPHCDDFPHEFVVASEHRNGYDHAVRAAGARLIEVGFNELASGSGVRRAESWEYAAAFTPRTAGVLYVLTPDSQPSLESVVRLAHDHQLPVLVDAASQLPPVDQLRTIAATGADLIAFSGGKAICGPQASGILCGTRSLIASAALQMLDLDDHPELWDPPSEFIDRSQLPGLPRHGIGRGFKVAKEQIVALLVALRAFTAGAYTARIAPAQKRLETIATRLGSCPVVCRILARDEHQLPTLEIDLDESRLGRTAFEICKRLRAGAPPCYVGHALLQQGTLVINPLHLDDAHTSTLAERLAAELTVN